jgi:hypothetical protein
MIQERTPATGGQNNQAEGHWRLDLPRPVREALEDEALLAGVREAIRDHEPPIPLKDLQARERALRAKGS